MAEADATAEQPVLLLSQAARALSGSDFLLFEDVDARLALSDIVQPAISAQFRRDNKPTPYFGFTRSAIWVRLDLAAEREGAWLLEADEPLLHHVDFYGPVQNDGAAAETQQSGRLAPFSQRSIQHRKILFELKLTPAPQTYYLRIASRDNLVVPLKLWPRAAFYEAELESEARLGIYYGIILALVAYNLFLLISLRDINYAYYSAYVLSFAGLQTTIDGSFFQIFPNTPPWLDWRAPIFFGFSAGFWLLAFTRNFLFMQATPRWLRWPGLGLMALIAGLFILALFDASMPFASRQANTASALTVLYAFACAVYRTASGYKPARFFLAGWLMVLSGVFGASLVNLGFFPPTPFTTNLMQLGFIAELLLFSFALADRINLLRQEKADADRRALENEQRTAAELESLVRKRTEQLSVALAAKDKFFSTIAHDLRGPIGTLAQLLSDGVEDDGRVDPPLLAAMRRTAHNSFRLLEELLTWARSQRGEIEPRPTRFPATDAVRDAINLFQTQADEKGVRINISTDESLQTFADFSMLSVVLRNLLSNAIKFTPRGGRVSVNVRAAGRQVEFSVSDTGVGISPEQRERLFRLDTRGASSPGTEGERGSGLGLILCREFAEKNGGRMGVDSEPGAGSRFWFTAPAA